MTKLLSETKVLLTNVRLSFPALFEPKSINGSEPKYSASLIISKDDTETLQVIEKAIEAAKEKGIAKFGGKIPKNLKTPLRDGDVERDEETYENAYFINANSKNAPEVVDRYKDPATGAIRYLDETEVYAGCYVNVTVNFYAFSASGNKGIAAGLGNVQKYKDGEPLGGRSSAKNDFDGCFEDGEEAGFLD